MTCLLSILAGVEKSGDEDLLEVVTTLYTETVLAFRRKLPPAMQLVDLLVEFEAEADRAKVMEAAVQGGAGGAVPVPAAHPTEVVANARHLITDLEAKAEVADRGLLARLCLVREEARLFADRLDADGTRTVVPGGKVRPARACALRPATDPSPRCCWRA